MTRSPRRTGEGCRRCSGPKGRTPLRTSVRRSSPHAEREPRTDRASTLLRHRRGSDPTGDRTRPQDQSRGAGTRRGRCTGRRPVRLRQRCELPHGIGVPRSRVPDRQRPHVRVLGRLPRRPLTSTAEVTLRACRRPLRGFGPRSLNTPTSYPPATNDCSRTPAGPTRKGQTMPPPRVLDVVPSLCHEIAPRHGLEHLLEKSAA